MASMKADYEGLIVQEFVSKRIAMAYTNMKTEDAFDLWIGRYCHTYRNSDGRGDGDYFIPELRKRKLELEMTTPVLR